MTIGEGVSGAQEQLHPGDAFYEKLGLPEDFGSGTVLFHGREIERRDYFFQPDVDPRAKQAYDVLSAMDPSDENFPRFRDAFVAAADQFVRGQ
jgi:hypothetical protein